MNKLFADSSILDPNQLSLKLKQGFLALFPTDTLPALGASPEFAFKLWNIKKRPLKKPLILMGSQEEDLFEFVLPRALKDARLMATTSWPGALTMVLPATGSVVDSLNPGQFNIGMRIPDCGMTRELLSISGPLATTSANLSGQAPSLDEVDAYKNFPDLSLLGPIPWPACSQSASTVIKWQKPGCWDIIRKGKLIPNTLHNE